MSQTAEPANAGQELRSLRGQAGSTIEEVTRVIGPRAGARRRDPVPAASPDA